MTFEEIGNLLRTEREKQGITIETVANKLKISPRLITALESGDIASLPHAAYARGFIRSYAKLLGISGDEIQGLFDDLPFDATERVSEGEPGIAAQHGSGGHAGKLLVILLIVAGLAGAAYWVWQSGRLDFLAQKQQPADFESRIPGAGDYLAGSDKSDYAMQQTDQPPVMESSQPETVSTPIETPSPVAVAPVEPVTEKKNPESIQPDSIADESSIQHKLIITATEECWIHSNADKTDTRQFSLRKGDTFALTFAKDLELKLGNAGGVRLRYDGKDLGPAGTSGQVKTIKFPVPSE